MSLSTVVLGPWLFQLLAMEAINNKRSVSYHGGGGDADGAGPSSQSSPEDRGWQFEVFLSFRGVDTRNGFIGHLYQGLVERGIPTVIDDKELGKGERVDELFGCIERSRMFVPIFSKGYADSMWCLREITKIVECGRLIIPVFFGVEPWEVRNQSGSFGPAFQRHESNGKLNKEEVSKWKDALSVVGEISGFNLKDTNWHEAELKNRILERIMNEVNLRLPDVAEYPIGLDSRVNEVIKLLDTEVGMVGICGMGGIGKTTLAKAVYNRLYSSFEACSFLANVREVSMQHKGIVTMQEQLLGDVFRTVTRVNNKDEGITMIRQRIGSKKVLVVIDDVDHKDQIHALTSSRSGWFGGKSRIIVTSRDENVFNAKQSIIYRLAELDPVQSLQLFSLHAFALSKPKSEKKRKLSKKVVSIAGGLPLCLKVLGSHFSDIESFDEWEPMLDKLKRDQHKEVHERLRISYDGLDEKTKCIFLDIVCFFVGHLAGFCGREWKENLMFMWEGSELFPSAAIRVLLRKSLISINNKWGTFEMHDQIRAMGRKIVQQESPVPSRFWENNETLKVLQRKQGVENIEGISLHLHGQHMTYLNTMSFGNMAKLRILDMSFVKLSGSYHCLPKSLKWLRWQKCPLKSLPITFHLSNIAVLDLTGSTIEQLLDRRLVRNSWTFCCLQETNYSQMFGQLKVLILRECLNLNSTPDFRLFPNAAKFIFDGCTELGQVHESIGDLQSLVCLNLRRCRSLEKIPDSICRLSSLETLDLWGCEKISTLPERLGDLVSLKKLILDELRKLTALPESVTCLTNLSVLSLNWCSSLQELPEQRGRLKALRKLQLGHGKIRSIPESVGLLTNLQALHIEWCNSVRALPESIGSLEHLDDLSIAGCKDITEVPDFFRGLTKLRTLNMSWTNLRKLPPTFFHLRSLERWEFHDCSGGELFNWPDGGINLTNFSSLIHVDFSWLNIRCIPMLPSSLVYLDARYCSALEIISDISNLNALRTLYLIECCHLADVPGLEKLRCIEDLDLRGCTSLTDALWDRMKEAKFEHYTKLCLPRRLASCCSPPTATGGLQPPLAISFLVPRVPHVGCIALGDLDEEEVIATQMKVVRHDGSLIFERAGMKWRGCSALLFRFPINPYGAIVPAKEEDQKEIAEVIGGDGRYRMIHFTFETASNLRGCSILLFRCSFFGLS